MMKKSKGTKKQRAPDKTDAFEFIVGPPAGWSVQSIEFINKEGPLTKVLENKNGFWKARVGIGSSWTTGDFRTTAQAALENLEQVQREALKTNNYDRS